MSKKFNWLTATAAVATLCFAGNALATNGYFTHGTGTKNKAMAGAGIALPEDSIDIANNPAVAPFVGDQLIVGAALFSPIRKYETWCTNEPFCANGNFGAFTIGPNKIKSDSNYHVIPHIAKSWQLENDSAFALVFYGRGGMNTDWAGGTATFDPGMGVSTWPGTFGDGIAELPINGTPGNGTTGVNLSQALLDITWAKKFNEKFSLGLSVVGAMQMFEAEGLRTFAPYTKTALTSGPQAVTSLSNNGSDMSWGYGFKIGIHAPLSDALAVGAMYQTKIKMTKLDDYSDLFAERGGFDMPANLKVGLTFKASDAIAISLDIEHTWFSEVKAVGNPIQGLFSCGPQFPENCLGGQNGAGFGWDDMTVYKAGLRWKTSDKWTWRAGYSLGDQPISNDQMTFNILAPAVIEQHFTGGFTFSHKPGREFNMSFMYAPNNSVTGPNNFDPSQTVMFEMYQWEVEASYAWRF